MTDQTERIVAILPLPIPAGELAVLLGALMDTYAGGGRLHARCPGDALQIVARPPIDQPTTKEKA